MKEKRPIRKPNKLKNYDYSTPGVYFITICTEKREPLFSVIEYAAHSVGEGSPLPQKSNFYPKLTAFGEIAERFILQISDQYPKIAVQSHVIMPDHIHLLLWLRSDIDGRGDPSPTVDTVIGWLKFKITANINQKRNTLGTKVFQRSFYDHVIRNQQDYDETIKYIYDNPMKWYYEHL